MDWNPPSRSMRSYRIDAAINRGAIPPLGPVEMTIGEAMTVIANGNDYTRRRDDGRLVALDFDAATTSLVETEVVDEWPE